MQSIFSSVAEGGFTAGSYFICLAASLICGLFTVFAASFKSRISKGFAVSLLLLPMIVDTVIVMVNGNIGTGVAVMGAFSLVRFRSVPGKAKDIVSIFLAMTAGLSCAAGYVGAAIVFTLIVGAAMIIFTLLPIAGAGGSELHITVPESLHFSGEFEDIFVKYTKSHELLQVKTTNMGSLFKLVYRIDMKKPQNVREFINELRCRNGNLEIAVTESREGEGEL